MIEIDPAGSDQYRANTDQLIADLQELHEEFEEGLGTCLHREFVVSHAAYGYLAARYGLEQIAVAGIDPRLAPTPSRLASIADVMGDHGLDAILVEPALSGAITDALASEVGAEVLQIHPLATVTETELSAHRDFLGLARATLASLKIAMKCE